MSSHDDNEDLEVVLADLERTLSELRSALREDVRRRRRPPTPTEFLRFTEEYTIPTVVSLLEATVRSLELLRTTLRARDAGGRTPDRRRPATSSGSVDVVSLRDALTELQATLRATDLPADAATREILTDAERLSGEIDDRLAAIGERRSGDAGRTEPGRARRDRSTRASDDEPRGVAIEVREEGTEGSEEVDVEAELASIKESVTAATDAGTDEGDDVDGDGDGIDGDGDGDDNEEAT
jgi:hypothetical protein